MADENTGTAEENTQIGSGDEVANLEGPAYLGGMFPSPFLINYKNIRPAPYKFIDPQKFAAEYGQFSREEIKKNFQLAQDMALQQLDTELASLQKYTPAAAALKRKETSIDNIFNQAQRTAQIEAVLPEVPGQLREQASRAEAYASGRLPDSVQDRALELGVRSRAADMASASGFGAGSVAGRKASDLMSAEQRLRLSQYGDQLLSQNVQLKANLLMAPTSYSNAGQQISVTPPVSAAQLTNANLSTINAMAGIPASTAYQTSIQQRQFKTNLRQATRTFNRQMNQNMQRFNADYQNRFALAKFAYETEFAGVMAGVSNANTNAEIAFDQQQIYQSVMEDYAARAQDAGTTSSIASVAPQLPSIISGISDAISGIKDIFGGSEEGVGSTPVDTETISLPGGGEAVQVTPDVQGVTIPSSQPVPVGMMPVAENSNGTVTIIPAPATEGQVQSFSTDTGANVPLDNTPVTMKLMSASTGTMNSAGLTTNPAPGSILVGSNHSGQRVYSTPAMASNNDPEAGTGVAQGFKALLDPTGVLSDEDASTLDKIGAAAKDAAFVSSLNQAREANDPRMFVNTVLNRYGQPVAEKLTSNPQDEAGVKAAFSAYTLFQNWDRLSAGQKSVALASIGIQGSRFAGNDISQLVIPGTKIEGLPTLNVGQALQLFSQGVNVYGLVKNWKDLNTLQKVTGGTTNISGLVSTAKSLNLLGHGTTGAAVPGITAAGLSKAGWAAAPSYGVGAISGPAGASIPAGYVPVPNVGAGQVALPAPNANTFIGKAGGVAAIAAGAYQVYKGWGQGGAKGALNGALGGSSMVAGLYALGYSNPYTAAALIAVSVLGNAIGTGTTNKEHIARNGIRHGLRDSGFLDEDYNLTLPDGTKYNVGWDDWDGEHQARYVDKLVNPHERNATGRLHSYDVDYTNDLDYVSSMGATSLMTIMAGSRDTNVKQVGGQIANANLANIGFGKDMTESTFNQLMTNMRATYSKAGVASKTDAYALANQAYAEGRISESDLLTLHHSFNMVFDEDGYELAQKLMAGRWNGVEVAAKEEIGEQPASPATPTTEDLDVEPPPVFGTPEVSAIPPGLDGSTNSNASPAEVLAPNKPSRGRTDSGQFLRSSMNLSKEQIKELNRKRYSANMGAAVA